MNFSKIVSLKSKKNEKINNFISSSLHTCRQHFSQIIFSNQITMAYRNFLMETD